MALKVLVPSGFSISSVWMVCSFADSASPPMKALNMMYASLVLHSFTSKSAIFTTNNDNLELTSQDTHEMDRNLVVRPFRIGAGHMLMYRLSPPSSLQLSNQSQHPLIIFVNWERPTGEICELLISHVLNSCEIGGF